MPKAHIASAMGVSRKCVKKWIDRYDEEGLAGLHDRSSRPHTMPTETAPEVEEKVLAARADHRDGPDVLASKVGVPARTISRILRRHESGPTARSSPATTTELQHLLPGSSTTTLNAATAHSRASPDQPTATNLMAGYI